MCSDILSRMLILLVLQGAPPVSRCDTNATSHTTSGAQDTDLFLPTNGSVRQAIGSALMQMIAR